MRKGIGLLLAVAVIGLFAMLYSVSLLPEPSPLAVSIIPPSYDYPASSGRNTVVVRLEPGEFLANEIEGLGEGILAGLRSGRVHAKEIATDYTQALFFVEPGEFLGGRVVFGRDERRVVTDFLQFQDSVFKFQVDFAPGLRSKVIGGNMRDIEDESLFLLNHRFTIVDADVSGNRVSLKLFGGYGSIEFTDGNFMDNLYSQDVKVNGQRVDGRVKIRASRSGDFVTIYSLQYILDADAAYGGDLEVLPLHCVREYLQHPTGMLSPSFDICYKGLSGGALPASSKGISGNEVLVLPRGDDEYLIIANNLHGRTYDIPVAQLPGMYGNKGRNFVFVEAPNAAAPNINLGDYFLVNSKDGVTGVSNVLRYDNIQGSTVYFEDLAGGNRKATFDIGTGEGQLLMGEGTYRFVVGPGNSLAMDQTNDNSISGKEAVFVLPGGTKIDFGPGFTIRVITPRRLFDEPTTDEVSRFNILFGSQIDLNVPSPQTTVPGYEFKLVSERGGIKEGLTKYGILYTWDKESDSDDLRLIVPGAYARSYKGGAMGEVFITLERARLMKPIDRPLPPPVCGDRIIASPEYCDPPGSFCAGPQPFQRGTCASDCMTCVEKPRPVCGNNLLENGEECESNADCAVGFGCSTCKCQPRPPAVCGNNLLENGEQCENVADCGAGFSCIGCSCIPAPPVQQPTVVVVEQPKTIEAIFSDFWVWFKGLFGY